MCFCVHDFILTSFDIKNFSVFDLRLFVLYFWSTVIIVLGIIVLIVLATAAICFFTRRRVRVSSFITYEIDGLVGHSRCFILRSSCIEK